MFYLLLFLETLSFLTSRCNAASAVTTDCLYNIYNTKFVPFNGTSMDQVMACASADSGNYIPFTLCNQNEPVWQEVDKDLSQRLPKGSRLFMGLSDPYQTIDYFFVGDGGYIWPSTTAYIVDTPDYNDTRKSCLALNLPAENSWRKQNHCDATKPFFYICEASQCVTPFKAVSLSVTANLCYKLPSSLNSQRTMSQADQDCKQIRGKLLTQDTFGRFPDEVAQVANDVLSKLTNGDTKVTFWMGDGTCPAYGTGMYMERVTCDFRDGDYFFCMQYKVAKGSYIGCFVAPAGNPVLSSEVMQIRYCVSICQAQGRNYAGTRNRDCFCFDQPPPATSEICSTTCPGNPGQPCGGPNSVSTYPTTTYFGPARDSCLANYMIGYYPPAGQPVKFKTPTNTIITCALETLLPPPGVTTLRPCPTGFVMTNYTCLYFGLATKTSNEAHRICQTMQGDLAHLSPQELHFVQMTVRRPRPFSQNDAWHFGPYSPRKKIWTWRDGRPMRKDDLEGFSVCKQPETDISQSIEKSTCYTLRDNNTIVDCITIIDPETELSFICKWNEKYIGVQDIVSDQGLVAEHHSTDMSVTACIQLCLTSNRQQIAQVKGDTCICSLDNIPIQSAKFDCQSQTICPGHSGQICGCDGQASIYYVDPISTPRYFSCDELQSNGVGVNGVYTLWPENSSDGNQTTICLFSNGTCSENFPVSYRGKCYSVNGEAKTHREAAQHCMEIGAITAIPNDADEERFLANLAKLQTTEHESWIGILQQKDTSNLVNITTKDDTALYKTGDKCSLLSATTYTRSYVDCDTQKPFICQEGKFRSGNSQVGDQK